MKPSILAPQRGLTLTEFMVSIVISMVAVLAIFQTFSSSEEFRRTATTGGDATYSGMLASHVLQRDLRMSGYGMNNSAVMGCRVLAWDRQRGGGTDFTFTFIPVEIIQGAGTAPDTITVSYGQTDATPASVKFTTGRPNNSAPYEVENTFGVMSGDLLIVAQPGQDCVLSQATNIPGLESKGNQNRILTSSGSYEDRFGNRVQSRYNKPGGLGPNYTADAVLFNLGSQPTSNRYSVGANGLQVEHLLMGTGPQPIASHVVQLQAQYGRDTSATPDGVVDDWTDIGPATPDAWARTLAIRFAMVSRSALPERPDPVTGACDETLVQPRWEIAGMNLDVTADPNWQCYRYRVFESTVSLRNMIWRP